MSVILFSFFNDCHFIEILKRMKSANALYCVDEHGCRRFSHIMYPIVTNDLCQALLILSDITVPQA